jgi:hypothetical protein
VNSRIVLLANASLWIAKVWDVQGEVACSMAVMAPRVQEAVALSSRRLDSLGAVRAVAATT